MRIWGWETVLKGGVRRQEWIGAAGLGVKVKATHLACAYLLNLERRRNNQPLDSFFYMRPSVSSGREISPSGLRRRLLNSSLEISERMQKEEAGFWQNERNHDT